MVERGQELRFALETLHARGVLGEGRRENFDSDVTIQLGARGVEHGPIPPSPSFERIL